MRFGYKSLLLIFGEKVSRNIRRCSYQKLRFMFAIAIDVG